MWAFFVALFGLIGYGLIKGNDRVSTISHNAAQVEVEQKRKEYKSLIMPCELNKIYFNAFKELTADDLIDLLYEDVAYILNKETFDFYDLFKNNQKAMYCLWSSHVGKVCYECNKFLWAPSSYNCIYVLTHSYEYNFRMDEEELLDRYVRLLQRIEFNIRKQYPEFHFNFIPCSDPNIIRMYGDKHPKYCKFEPFYNTLSTHRRFRLWEDKITNPDSIGAEDDEQAKPSNNTVELLKWILLLIMTIIILMALNILASS